MAGLDKYFNIAYTTGATVYCEVIRLIDGYKLNDANGAFAAAPVDPYISLTESATVSGMYELVESRTGWNNGNYFVIYYSQLGGSPAPATDTVISGSTLTINGDYISTPTVSPLTGVLLTLVNSLRNTTRDVDNGVASELLWSDDEWIEYLNEGEREIARRTYCLLDLNDTVTALTGVATYAVSNKILFIERLIPSWDTLTPIEKKTRKWLDSNYYGWRNLAADKPRYFVEEQNHTITLVPAPSITYNTLDITLETRRYPISDISDSNTTPEIDFRFYEALKQYALFKAYLKKDSQTLDSKAAATHYSLFESQVGPGYSTHIESIAKEEPEGIQFGRSF